MEIRKFELWYKYSMIRVKRFLLKWIRFIKQRNLYYKANLDKIIKSQAFLRGRIIRNKYNIKKQILNIK